MPAIPSGDERMPKKKTSEDERGCIYRSVDIVYLRCCIIYTNKRQKELEEAIHFLTFRSCEAAP